MMNSTKLNQNMLVNSFFVVKETKRKKEKRIHEIKRRQRKKNLLAPFILDYDVLKSNVAKGC